jgi:hypothetical protein
MLAENFQIVDQYMHRIFLYSQEENKFTRRRREIRYKRIKSVFIKAKNKIILLRILHFFKGRKNN